MKELYGKSASAVRVISDAALESLTPAGVIMSINELKLKKCEGDRGRAFKRNAKSPGFADLSIPVDASSRARFAKVKRTVYF